MAAEELVERVVAGDVHGEAGRAPPRTAPHLAEARHRPREGHADCRVELADVDAELERARGRDTEQLALHQPPLDLAALGGRVAGAVGRDPLRQVAAPTILEAQPREAMDQLDPAARPQEADRAGAALHELGQEVGRLAQRRRPRALGLVEQRRVPHGDLSLRPRGSVAVDELEVEPGQPLGELDGIGDRRAREHKARLGAVGVGEAAQPPQHIGDVGAEDAPVGVGLVDDHEGEVGEDVAPVAVVRQHAHVEHVGVGEDEVRSRPDGAPLLAGGVPVVDRGAQERGSEGGERAGLVLGERLGRVQVERPGAAVTGEDFEHRQVEGQRLAAGGARGDDGVAAFERGLEGLGLVRPEVLDADPAQGRGHRGVEPVVRQDHPLARPSALTALGHELLTAAGLEQLLPRRRGDRRGHEDRW